MLVDPTTFLPALLNADIGAVVYAMYMDLAVSDDLTFLGTSTDAAHEFELPFTTTEDDFLISATPYDLMGNPIFAPGVDNENVAVGLIANFADIPLPEPGSFILLASGMGGVWLVSRSIRGDIKL